MKNRVDKTKASSKRKVIRIGLNSPEGKLLEVWDVPEAEYREIVAHCRKEKLTLEQWLNKALEEYFTAHGYIRGGKAVRS